MKRTAEDVAESVSGVRDVRNELRATPSSNTMGDQQHSLQSGEKNSSDGKREAKTERNRMPS
jgi:hypothetical protein